MLMLAEANCLFVGQGVNAGGLAMGHDFEGVPSSQRIEFPVAEELQLGYCSGLSLMGYRVVSVFPRMDFLMRAMDQLVNHLDKLEEMSRGQFHPKVIVKTRVGTRTPLDAGPQHTQDHTEALRLMLRNVKVIRVEAVGEVLPAYAEALSRFGSTVVVEALGC